MLNYSNFLKVSNFKKSQVPESEYFRGLVLESEENGPSDPQLRAYWEKYKDLRSKQKPRIIKAVTMVVSKLPLFGDFLQHSRFIWDHPAIKTMATDGKNIFISSEFCSRHTERQLMFVLVHEVMHITLLHHFRMADKGVKNARKWNIATDLEINPYCTEIPGLITAQEIKDMDGLYDEKFLKMPAEMIFDKLPEPPKSDGGGDPPPPQPSEPQEPKIGDYVRLKDGSLGRITDKNSDGSWEIVPATKEQVDTAMKRK